MSQMLRIEIGKRTIEVPVQDNEESTRAIAKMVNERFAEIEAGSSRIDTQVFALQAAFDFAAALWTARQEQEHGEKELALALDTLLERLRRLEAGLGRGR